LLRCSQQIAAAFLMESRVVWFGLDDVCGISRQPGKLVNHHIRRGGRDRLAYCLAVEGIGGGGRSTDFTQSIDARPARVMPVTS